MMEKDSAASRYKFVSVWILLLAGTCLTLAILSIACSSPGDWATPRPFTVPESFPTTDIVYYYKFTSDLGFINADGSSNTTVPFRLAHIDVGNEWGSPFLAEDGKALVVTRTMYPGEMGGIFIAQAGKTVVDCGWHGIARPAADGYHILVETTEGQAKYRPEHCGTGNPAEKLYPGVFGALSPDEKYAAEAHWWTDADLESKSDLHLRELGTGTDRVIGEGAFPVWSRDGQWLAYTGADGIYIVRNNTDAQPSRLVPLESPEPSVGHPVYQNYPPDHYYPSIVSWSPDGKWLVYHMYLGSDGAYAIVKTNVETGETVKLLDNGISPSWRWPVEEP